jgi:type III restriction enzyme
MLWYQYSFEQHYTQVNPIFLMQVLAGSGKAVSDTNLDDVIVKIEERLGSRLKEHEVVHTFGSTPTLTINGLQVEHIEPSDITEDKRVRVVLFKENLSTGWDCPRAETMMSFRHAEDATYIAQLLGRMVRTPLQCHILVDDSLNDVRLFLPYFNMNTVKTVIDELQSTEGGDIPTVIDGESLEQPKYVPWTVHTRQHNVEQQVPGQVGWFEQSRTSMIPSQPLEQNELSNHETDRNSEPSIEPNPVHPQTVPTQLVPIKPNSVHIDKPIAAGVQTRMAGAAIDREAITKFINDQSLLTYLVRSVKVSSYAKSLLNLASLLTRENIFLAATDEVKADVVDMIRHYVEELHRTGKYKDLASQVLSFKLSVRVFDVFGESLDNGMAHGFLAASESDLDRQLRAADARMNGYGFPNYYGHMSIA